MVNYEIVSEEVASNCEVLDIVGKKDEEELTYREEKVLEYIKKANPLSMKDFEKAFKEFKSLDIARLEDEHIIKLIDINPIDGTEIRSIVSNSGTVIVDENVTKILDVLKKYN